MQEKQIFTIGDLRNALSKFNDNDLLVVEVHDRVCYEDLYHIDYVDVIDGIKLNDGREVSEIRLCI